MASRHTFAKYKIGYTRLLRKMKVKASWIPVFKRVSNRIKRNKERYETVSRMCGGKIPWEFIGVIHNLECSLSFNKHLHNGDSLKRKTRRVPAGRPRSRGPWTWEQSAVDALKMKNFHKINHWSMERMCYELERYNGFGYRNKGINTPYLWSGTTVYTKGKYIRDHVFSRSAVSKQTGTIPLLIATMNGGSPGKIDVKDLTKKSSKMRFLQRFINFFKAAVTSIAGLFGVDFFTDSLGVIGKAKEVVSSEPTLLALGGMICLTYVISEWLKYKHVKDAQEGRYIPSGDLDEMEDLDGEEVDV